MATDLTAASPEAALLEPALPSDQRMRDTNPSWLRSTSTFEPLLGTPLELPQPVLESETPLSWGSYGAPFLPPPPLPPSSPTWAVFSGSQPPHEASSLFLPPPPPPPPPSSPTWCVCPGSEASDLMDAAAQPPTPTMQELIERFAALSFSEDAVDGSFNDAVLKIIKGALAYILDRIIEEDLREACVGCSVNHPSQRRHTCLYEPESFYFCSNFEKLTKKLYRPWFKHSIVKAITMFFPRPAPVKVQGVIEAVVSDLKDKINVRAKLRQLIRDVEDQYYECAVNAAINDFWDMHKVEQTLVGV